MFYKDQITIIPTIDVEASHGRSPFKDFVTGDLGGKGEWGVFRIADTFKQYGVQGTFFVDIYEYTMWGEDRWQYVCEGLLERGQDVQLHTHPGWKSNDPRDIKNKWLQELKKKKSFVSDKRYLMTHLSYQEQLEFLSHGKDLLKKWTGVSPIAHRSGEYAANLDTLDALNKLGFKIDSSQYRGGHPSCNLALTYNKLSLHEGILEVPITIYDRCFVKLGLLGKIKKRTKTDLANGARELKLFVADAVVGNLPIVNLFMHSFSLVRRDQYDNLKGPNYRAFADLVEILEWANHSNFLRVETITQYYQRGEWRKFIREGSSDLVPNIAAPKAFIRAGLVRTWNTVSAKWI